MIQYTKNLWKKIRELSILKKILLIFGVCLYIGILLICIIPIESNYTSPGTLNRVSQVITVTDADVQGNFYTVSVYSDTKNCSLLEYWLRSLDKKQSIMPEEEYETIYTVSERNRAGEAQKTQSIQDSIICAYEMAKEDGYNVELKKEYKGVMICYMPANKLGTGPESLQPKDVITQIGDTKIDNVETLCTLVKPYFDNRKTINEMDKPVITILRSGQSVTLDNCNLMCLVYLGAYYQASLDYQAKYSLTTYKSDLVNYMFDYYELNTEESNPKFTIDEATSTGPSGGLSQTLFVYNAITSNSLFRFNGIITATGTIFIDGTVGEIGSVDKKVYTIDVNNKIYNCKYFFVPKANYEDAMDAYKTIKNPNFEIVSVDNVRDAVQLLKSVGE